MGTANLVDIPLQDFGSASEDVERQAPEAQTLRRNWLRRSWGLQWTAQHDVAVGDGGRAVSIRSNASSWKNVTGSMINITKWRPRLNHESVAEPILDLGPNQRQFVMAFTSREVEDLSESQLPAASKWYIAFIEQRARQCWLQILKPILEGVDPTATEPGNEDMQLVFKLLTKVIIIFAQEDSSMALCNIVDGLLNEEGLLKRLEDDEDDALATQLAFTILGWISMLYVPHPSPAIDNFQISDHPDDDRSQTPTRRRRFDSGPNFMFNRNMQEIAEYRDKPLGDLLEGFGKLIPRSISSTQQHTGSSFPRHYNDRIDLSLFTYYTINKIAKINIQWVDCLNLHLEFDRKCKTLKMFRFPSFCLLLMCASTKEPSVVSHVFHGSSTIPTSANQQAFFKEVLLSYRLVFGQDKEDGCPDFKREWNRNWSSLHDGTSIDPLLHIICGYGWEAPEVKDIYDKVGARTIAEDYDPITDFPYLGKKLQELQQHVKHKRNKNLKDMWNDKQRDNNWWWAFWAVIILSSITLLVTVLFAIAQLALQIVQVNLARQQLSQGSSAHNDQFPMG